MTKVEARAKSSLGIFVLITMGTLVIQWAAGWNMNLDPAIFFGFVYLFYTLSD